MKKSLTFVVLILLTFGFQAQNDKTGEYTVLETLLDKNWTGQGILMGNEATFTMNWSRVLNDSFIKLEFQNQRTSGNNTVVFRATAFYKIVNDTVVGNWFDNRGVSLPLSGTVNENELVILWGNEETEEGKTIYRYISDTKIGVDDFVKNSGEYAKFGNATYTLKD